jgi:hypothetical protein
MFIYMGILCFFIIRGKFILVLIISRTIPSDECAQVSVHCITCNKVLFLEQLHSF